MGSGWLRVRGRRFLSEERNPFIVQKSRAMNRAPRGPYALLEIHGEERVT
jgi:hypothetical protein